MLLSRHVKFLLQRITIRVRGRVRLNHRQAGQFVSHTADFTAYRGAPRRSGIHSHSRHYLGGRGLRPRRRRLLDAHRGMLFLHFPASNLRLRSGDSPLAHTLARDLEGLTLKVHGVASVVNIDDDGRIPPFRGRCH